jgi:hypothetical protein
MLYRAALVICLQAAAVLAASSNVRHVHAKHYDHKVMTTKAVVSRGLQNLKPY